MEEHHDLTFLLRKITYMSHVSRHKCLTSAGPHMYVILATGHTVSKAKLNWGTPIARRITL
jgi:hypothetical protein